MKVGGCAHTFLCVCIVYRYIHISIRTYILHAALLQLVHACTYFMKEKDVCAYINVHL